MFGKPGASSGIAAKSGIQERNGQGGFWNFLLHVSLRNETMWGQIWDPPQHSHGGGHLPELLACPGLSRASQKRPGSRTCFLGPSWILCWWHLNVTWPKVCEPWIPCAGAAGDRIGKAPSLFHWGQEVGQSTAGTEKKKLKIV